jgi:hypothetical protein
MVARGARPRRHSATNAATVIVLAATVMIPALARSLRVAVSEPGV